MKNYKIIINESELSSEEIAARKDFDGFIKNYNKVSKPFFKTTWFLSASIITLVTAAYVFSYTTNNTDNVVLANVHSVSGKAKVENTLLANSIELIQKDAAAPKGENVQSSFRKEMHTNADQSLAEGQSMPKSYTNNPAEVSAKEKKLSNNAFFEETNLKSDLTEKEVIEKKYSSERQATLEPLISTNKTHDLVSKSNEPALKEENNADIDQTIEEESGMQNTNNDILNQANNENLIASLASNNGFALPITNEDVKIIDTESNDSSEILGQNTLLVAEPLKNEVAMEAALYDNSEKLVDNNKPKYSKWTVGISFSPDYSYRVLKPFESGETEYENLVDSLNLIEKGKLAFTLGISLSYKFNGRFSIRTGLYYSDKGIQSKGFVYRNGIYPGSDIFKQDVYKKTKFYFYEVPLTVSYAMALDSEKKYILNLFIGGTASINSQKHDFISRRWFDPIENDPNDESSYWVMYAGANSIMHIGYTAGFGFNMRATERIDINIEPVFKYYAFQFYSRKSAYMCLGESDNPYSYGCNIGINYNF